MREDILEKMDLILEMINKNRPKSEISKKLGCKHNTLNVYLKKMGIVYSGNIGLKGIKKNSSFRKSAMHYIENDIHISSNRLKKKLIEDGIKEYKCECCGLTEWLDEPIPLELHHIDGNSYNNKLYNLSIICPNCHFKTHNYSGRKIKMDSNKTSETTTCTQVSFPFGGNKIPKNEKLFKCECGVEIKKKSKVCKDCHYKSLRVVERPNFEQLMAELSESSYCAVAKKYGVSDNAIRKWIKNFKKD